MKLQELLKRLQDEYSKWGDVPVTIDIAVLSDGVLVDHCHTGTVYAVDHSPGTFGENPLVGIHVEVE